MPTIIGTFPITLMNGQAADAAGVMALFTFIQSQVNTNVGVGAGLTPVYKLTAQSVSLIGVPQPDQALFFNVVAGVYVFKVHAPFASLATNGFRFEMNGTATKSVSRYLYQGFWDIGSGGVAQAGNLVGTSAWPAGPNFVPSGSGTGFVDIVGTVTTTGVGTVGFYWAQSVPGANAAQVPIGAFLEFAQIA